MSHTERGPVLLQIARQALARALGLRPDGPAVAPHDWLHAPGASFVTLTQAGQLRGCIGRLEATRPLHADVAGNAVAAALHDPRFAPLPAHELAGTVIEVSLLSAREPLAARSEAELLAQLRPGIDGLVLRYGTWHSTFLPQVWTQLPEPGAFLAALRRKAGLAADFWADGIRLERYTVSHWQEAEAPAGRPAAFETR